MLVGAHVRAGPQLTAALGIGAELSADVVQIFTQSPRAWKPNQYAPEALDRYRSAQSEAAAEGGVQATFCHATYLINLAGPDPELHAKSLSCLAANLAVAEAIGSLGLVLHLGSHRGAGMEACLPQVADALVEVLDQPGTCPVLLENTAGAGGTVGRSFGELAAVVELVAKSSPVAASRLGVCLDTQHLWASGVDFTSRESADKVVRELDAALGLARLRCIHLNDSKVPFASARDRHANLGEGTIGAEGLASLLGHPALDDVAAILEVPGSGKGPRGEDVGLARRLVADGVAKRVHD